MQISQMSHPYIKGDFFISNPSFVFPLIHLNILILRTCPQKIIKHKKLIFKINLPSKKENFSF